MVICSYKVVYYTEYSVNEQRLNDGRICKENISNASRGIWTTLSDIRFDFWVVLCGAVS